MLAVRSVSRRSAGGSRVASSPALRLATDGANYHCTIHPTMVGSINASSGEPPPCTDYCPGS